MTTTSKFSMGGEDLPPKETFVFVEYLKDGKYGLFVRQPQWRSNMPVPKNVYYTVVHGRMYICVNTGVPGSDDNFDAVASGWSSVLEMDGIYMSSVCLHALDMLDEDDINSALTDGERHWWSKNDGPYPGDDWYFKQEHGQ